MKTRTINLAAAFLLGAFSTLTIEKCTFSFVHPASAQIFVNEAAIPVVPPLGGDVVQNLIAIGGATYQLDGYNTQNATFVNPVFRYGGGAYRLNSSLISGSVTLVLTGAAANTAILLNTFGLLNMGPPPRVPPAVEKGKPVERAVFRSRVTGDFVSPYGEKK